MEHSEGEEGAKMLRHQDGVEAHHRNACCTEDTRSALSEISAPGNAQPVSDCFGEESPSSVSLQTSDPQPKV